MKVADSLAASVVLMFLVPCPMACSEELQPVTELRPLEWLLGTWQSDDIPTAADATGNVAVARIVTTFRRANDHFVLEESTVETDATSRRAMTSLTGMDLRSKQITTWFFRANGDHGRAELQSDGATMRWTFKAFTNTGEASGTTIWKRIDPDTFTQQSTRLKIGDRMLPDGPVITLRRQPAR